MSAYFDNAATTQLCDAAALALSEASEKFGNPSSLHAAGLEAEKLLTESRRSLLKTIGAAQKDTLVFTGCGTESNALALFGTAYAKPMNRGGKIVISDSEHPSVYNAAEELGRRGFEVRAVKTYGGRIDAEELISVVDDRTFLVSIMTVNNETGACYDIEELCRAVKAKAPHALFHTDATQAFMKTDINVSRTGVDMMTLSAHKIGGPKGVGALFIKEPVLRSRAVVPVLYGGGQEGGLRSGTENTAGIAAFAAAARYGAQRLDEDIAHAERLRAIITEGLIKLGVRILSPKAGVPHIIAAILPGIKSEIMLHQLSSSGVYVSSGSACSSHHPGISRSLTAFGLQKRDADCTVRISIFRNNTEKDADLLLNCMENGVKNLIKQYK